jgi:hypothetical protein
MCAEQQLGRHRMCTEQQLGRHRMCTEQQQQQQQQQQRLSNWMSIILNNDITCIAELCWWDKQQRQ